MKWCFTVLLFFPGLLWAQNWQQEIAREPNPSFFQIQQSFEEEWSAREKERGKGYKPFKRWEWFWEQRVGKSGQFPQGAFMAREWDQYLQTHPKAQLLNRQLPAYKLLQQDTPTPLALPNGNWESMGPESSPGGYNGIGRVNCVGFHPTDPKTLWVGTPAGGLWKTTDNGKNWTTNTDNLPVLGISSIAIDYTNPDIIYIATGDAENAYGIPGQPSAGYTQSVGVMKSTDGGITWKSTGLNWEVEDINLIGTVLIHPVYPNILLAATSDGIYKTENGGETWKRTQAGHFQDMEFKPGEPSVVYASTFSWGGTAQIYKSSDTGSKWKVMTKFAGLLRIALAVTPADPTFVYAFCANTSDRGFGGFYRSTDSGDTYSLIYSKEEKNLLGWNLYGSDKGGQGWYDLALTASPTDKNLVYAGGVNTWKTTDGGKNWYLGNVWFSSSSYPTVHADKHFLAYNSIEPNALFEGNDGGIYKMTNESNIWEDLTNGIQITQFYRLGTSATNNDFVVAGSQDNGTKRLVKDVWYETLGGDGMECIIDYEDESIRYYSQQNGSLYRSKNGLNVYIGGNIPDNHSGAWVTPFVMDPADHKTLYAGFQKVYKTTDQGDSWKAISDDFGVFTLTVLAVAPSSSNTIYTGNSYELFVTHDGGKKWQTLSNYLPNAFNAMTYLAIHPEDPKTLWITYSGYNQGTKVFESIDGGLSWKNISDTLPNLPVNCIVYQKGSAGNMYIGTDVGVFYRNQYMSDWEVYSEGLPNVIVTELEIQYGAGKIRAATFGRGLWESDLVPADPVIPIQESDSLALVALYYSTNGEQWENNEGWLEKPVREWAGITVEGNQVEEISLGDNKLKGSIPSNIGDLKQLVLLSLNDNELSGPIPAEIGKLKKLKFLYLNGNQLSGPLPVEIGDLNKLKELIVSHNELNGPLPSTLLQLTTLNTLDVSFNKFEDAIPENIGNLEELRILLLHENSFSGLVPGSLGNLAFLNQVNLSHNLLEGDFPTLNFPVEELLDISDNNFTGLPALSDKITGTLAVAENALTFEDILPNLDISDFTYTPQADVGEGKNITASEGDKFVIDLGIDKNIKNNQYTWFKDGEEIAQAKQNQFVIEAIVGEDAGEYTCTITNNKVKDLTLTSKPVILTIDHRSQYITFEDIPNKTYGDAPFEVSATASSGLPVTLELISGPATLDENTLTITGAGKVTLEAEQGGNENFNAADPVEKSFQISKAPQSITFKKLDNKVFGDLPVTLSATATSGLPVTFTIVDSPATLADSILTLNGAGTITVRAEQTGNENYLAAEPIENSFEVAKASQSITFLKPDNKTYLDPPFPLEGSASSGLPVSFSIVKGPAEMDTLTENSNNVNITGAGSVTIKAEQLGNENYKAAEPIEHVFQVNKASQTITFHEIDSKSPIDPPFALEALATSGLEVNFVLISGPATLDGNILTLTGSGEVVVRAEQEGNDDFLPANPQTQNFIVLKGFQRITFNTISDRIFGDEPFELKATASSSLPVQYSIISGPAVLDDNLLTLTGAGTVTVLAEQPGDGDFEPAASVEQRFEVAKGFQNITFNTLSDHTFGDEPIELDATISSGLPIQYTVTGPAVLDGNLLTLIGAGTVTVLAEHPGNGDFESAASVERSFVVAKGTQTLTFEDIVDKTFGDSPFKPSASSSTGLPVTFVIVSGPAIIEDDLIKLVGIGEVTIRASQPGSDNYEAAASQEQTFTVTKGTQTIAFTPIEDKAFNDPPFAPEASASSGLAVSLSIVSGPATLEDGKIKITGTGTVIVKAEQAGSENVDAAESVEESFEVVKADQTISFDPIENKKSVAEPFSPNATASSGLPVTFSVNSGPATISDDMITLTGEPGEVTILASQEGNDNYEPAPNIMQSFTVISLKEQAITFPTITNHMVDDPPFTLSATSNSGLEVTFEIVSGPAVLDGNTVTLEGVGTVVVRATQAGNDEFSPAEPVERSFEVDEITSIEEEIVKAGLKISPNPAETQLNLEIDLAQWLGGQVSIRDAIGNEVAQYKITSENMTIDLAEKSKGMYMIIIRKDQELFIFKFVKQ